MLFFKLDMVKSIRWVRISGPHILLSKFEACLLNIAQHQDNIVNTCFIIEFANRIGLGKQFWYMICLMITRSFKGERAVRHMFPSKSSWHVAKPLGSSCRGSETQHCPDSNSFSVSFSITHTDTQERRRRSLLPSRSGWSPNSCSEASLKLALFLPS